MIVLLYEMIKMMRLIKDFQEGAKRRKIYESKKT